MNAADGKRQRTQPSNSVHCYCCPYARTVSVDNHTSEDARIVDDGYHNNGYEYVVGDDIKCAASNVDEVHRQYVSDKRSRSHGHGDLPVGAVRSDRSTAPLAEAADRKQLPRRQRSSQSDAHCDIGQTMSNGVVSTVIDDLAFAPAVDNYGQRQRVSGTDTDVARDGSAIDTTMGNSRSGATMSMYAREGLPAPYFDGQHQTFIGRGDVGGRITSTALPRRPERCVNAQEWLNMLTI